MFDPRKLAALWCACAAQVGAQQFVPTASASPVGPAAAAQWSLTQRPLTGDFDGSGLADVLAFDANGAAWLFADPGAAPAAALAAPIAQASVVPGAATAVPLRRVAARLDAGASTDLLMLSVDPFTGLLRVDAFLSAGAGGFAAGVPVATVASSPASALGAAVIAADFDGDGLDEAALSYVSAAGGASAVAIFKSTPTGWTNLGTVAGWLPGSVRSGDFDGDGKRDLVSVGVVTATPLFGPPHLGCVVYRGNAAGIPTFSGGYTTTTAGGAVSPVGVADFDGDGRSDIALAVTTPFVGAPSPALATALGASAPFSALVAGPSTAVSSSVASSLSFAAVADVDADGRADVLSAYPSGYSSACSTCPSVVSIAAQALRGLGGGAFGATPRTLYSVSTAADTVSWLADADFDGDGDVDFVGVPVPGGLAWFVENRALYGAGCAGAAGVPRIDSGAAALGNAGFALSVASAAPGAPALLGVSLGASYPIGCGPLLDLAPGVLLLPAGAAGLAVTDAAGAASVALPLPAAPALVGTVVRAQWAVLDPSGSFAGAFALSRGRTLTLW